MEDTNMGGKGVREGARDEGREGDERGRRVLRALLMKYNLDKLSCVSFTLTRPLRRG